MDVDVCNVCRDPRREVRTFSFRAGEGLPEEGHLCGEHMAVAVEALRGPEDPGEVNVAPVKKAAAKKAAAKTGGRRSTRTKTLEEIAAEKAAAQA
jgi:hypothetical protein